ncbi:MAG: MFS transporter [Nitrososphaerota archaeon]|nr:MFS transporter [Nitrososphaerota archaeon]
MQRSPALRSNRNFLYLLGGRGFSEFGDYFGELAISWLVYTGTGSVLSLGVTWLFFLIPRSAVRLWGGVYVDRLNKKALMILTETVRGAIFGLLAAAVTLGLSSAPLVYVVSFSVGLVGAIFDIASQAILPQAVEPSMLLAANSYLTAAFQVDSVLGPLAAGVAIYAVGLASSLSIDSASFFVLVVALSMLRLPADLRIGETARSWRAEFRRGWSYFRSKGELVWLSALVAGINFGLGGFWYVYALVLAKNVLNAGSTGFGALNAFAALGILATSLYIGRRGLRRRRLSVVASIFVLGFFVSLTAFARTLPEALVTVTAFGAAIPLISVVQNTYYQETVPREMMGRAFGFQQFFDYVTIPAGIVFAIFADMMLGVDAGIFLSGVVILVFGAAGVAAKSLWKLNPPPEATSLPR